MKYPVFFDQYKSAIKNTWTVEEVDFSIDLSKAKPDFGFPQLPSSFTAILAFRAVYPRTPSEFKQSALHR
jgi:hypothetical protein